MKLLLPNLASPHGFRLCLAGMSRNPHVASKVSDEGLIRQMLAPYIERGLHVSFENNHFHFRYKERTDTGTMRQPPRVVVACAARMFE